MKQSSSSIIGLLVSGVVIVAPWQCSSFTATVTKKNAKSQQLYSSLTSDSFYNDINNNPQYFNSPSYPSHELRWALKVQVGLDERNFMSLFDESDEATTSAQALTSVDTTSSTQQSRGRTITRAIEHAQQAYCENREVEAYNLLNPLEKQQRRMDGPKRSRLESVEPLSSVRRVQAQENFVFQYADAESVEFTKTVEDIVQGTLLEDVLVRTAAELGKQSASLLGGSDPENWID